MSNIGKNLIHIPSSLTITKLDFDLDFYTLIFYGPLGKVSINIPKYINININNNSISLFISDDKKHDGVMWATSRNLINQAIIGVTTGYTKRLELIGIGYKVTYNNNILTFFIGKSHPINIPVVDNVTIKLINTSTITASSISNTILTKFLHSICQIKPYYKDHYKGKGIKII